MLGDLRKGGAATIPGKTVFTMYDTFGFPEDLTRVIAEEHGMTTDKAGYDAELDAAKARSRFKMTDTTVAPAKTLSQTRA